MKPPGTPVDEVERLRELHALDVLDTGADAAFDALTDLAARILKAPIALVTLVDANRQWFKSRHGLDVAQTPRDVSFCGHVVADGKPLVVCNAHADLRFSDNPLVTGAPEVCFYAGVPLRTAGGHDVGTLCVIDHTPREFSDENVETLTRLAGLVVNQLEVNRRLQMVQRVTDSVPGMLGYWGRDKRCVFANAAYEQWFGVKPQELIGKTMEQLLGPIYPLNLPYIERALQGEKQSFEREIPDPNGGPPRYSHAHYLPHISGDTVHGFVVMVTDITSRRSLEEQLRSAQAQAEARATHDALTGLPNRLLLEEHLQRAIAYSKRYGTRLALLFLDMDGFKSVNDSLGHGVGDALLKGVAQRLTQATRESDLVGRLAGDEFLVVLPEVGSKDNAACVANKFLEAMAATPIMANGHALQSTFSVGIALYPDDAADITALMACADGALYQAKRAGKNRYAFVQPEQG